MFLEVRHRFLDSLDALKPKVRRAFLAGKITFAEAEEFSSRSLGQSKRLVNHVDLLHAKRHDVLLREHADMNIEHTDIYDLTTELDHMPGHIAVMVMNGQLTLLQARFAVRKRFGAKGVQELARANVPTQPYRTRKYKLGTEHSVRAPIVRVRPHLPKKR